MLRVRSQRLPPALLSGLARTVRKAAMTETPWCATQRTLATMADSAPGIGSARAAPPRNTKQLGQALAEQKRTRRFWAVGLGLLAAGSGVFVLLNIFEDSLMFYLTPTQLLARDPPMAPTRKFRLGGMVEKGSVVKSNGDTKVKFVVTDLSHSVQVEFEGALPGLFKEGSGVVAEGKIQPNGIFVASEVLAKHDENYMPKDIADQIELNKQAMAAKAVQGTPSPSMQ